MAAKKISELEAKVSLSGAEELLINDGGTSRKVTVSTLSVGGGGGLTEIVQDTTPQLGGTLDANGNIIDMGTNNITDTKVGQWDTAYGWGDHASAGYLTSYTETDPVVGAITGIVKADGAGNISAAVAGTDYLTSVQAGDIDSQTATDGYVLTADGAGGAAWEAVSGGGGGITYVVKTANYTASAGEGILADTSGGAFTITLPSSPSTGDQVIIADSGSAWNSNNLTVGRNGSTIEGSAADLTLDIEDALVELIYDGSTWQVFTQIGAGGLAHSENFNTASSSSGTATLDLSTGNVFSVTLTENISTFTWSNAPASGTAYGFTLKIVQDSTARTITWPAGVDWVAATAPTLSSGSGDVDIFAFFTHDGGTTWYGFTAGQDLS